MDSHENPWMCVFAYFCIIVFLHQHWQNIRSWQKFFSGCTTATLHYNTWPAWVEFWTSLLSGSKTFCFHFDWWYYQSERSWAVVERRHSKCATLNYVHFMSALHRWFSCQIWKLVLRENVVILCTSIYLISGTVHNWYWHPSSVIQSKVCSFKSVSSHLLKWVLTCVSSDRLWLDLSSMFKCK